MKRLVGIVAGIIGGLVLVAGTLAMAFFAMYASIPDNEHVPGVKDPAVPCVLVTILGAVLCYASWRLLRRPHRQELRVCTRCGCHIGEDTRTCLLCGQGRPLD